MWGWSHPRQLAARTARSVAISGPVSRLAKSPDVAVGAQSLVHLRLFPWAVRDGRSFNHDRSVRDAESAVMRDGEFQSENVALVLGLTERPRTPPYLCG